MTGQITARRENNFDLGMQMPLQPPAPDGQDHLGSLRLTGVNIGKVRSVMPFMLTDHIIHAGRYARRLEMRVDVQPLVGGPCSLLGSAVHLIWTALLNPGVACGTAVDEPSTIQRFPVLFDLQLNEPQSRYYGEPVLMFNDMLHTLLMDGAAERDQALIWDDPSFATKLARHWKAHDPEMVELPASVREALYSLADAQDTDTVYEESLDFLMSDTYGLCFVVTEDNRMGLCSPDTADGDLIVAFFGGSVPYVVRQRAKDPSISGNESEFEFVGECYLHGRMSSQSLREVIEAGVEISEFNLV